MDKQIRSIVRGILIFHGDIVHRFNNLEVLTKQGQNITSAASYYFKQKGYTRFKGSDIDIRTVTEQVVLF